MPPPPELNPLRQEAIKLANPMAPEEQDPGSAVEEFGPSPLPKPNRISSGRWVFIGMMAAKPLQILANVALARILGPAKFGLFGLVNSAAVSLAGLVGFGLDGAANKFIAEYYRRWPEKGRSFASLIVWFSLVLSLLVFTVLWFVRGAWGLRFFPANASIQTVNACLLLAWLYILLTLWNNVLTGLQLFREIAILGTIQLSLMALIGLGMGFRHGVRGALAGYILSGIMCAALGAGMIWRIDRHIFDRPHLVQWADIKTIFNFSFPAWLGYFTVGPVTTLVLSFLGRQPNGAMHMGYFDTASSVKLIVGILPAVVTTVLGPALIEEAGACGRPAVFKELLMKTLTAITFLTMPVLIPTLFWSDLLVFIYGRLYIHSIEVFIPLTSAFSLTVISIPVIMAFVGRNRIWTLQVFALFYSLLLFLFTRWWVPGFLSIGLSWAFFAAQAVYNIFLYEFGVFKGFVPSATRTKYYGFHGSAILILALAWLVPRTGRWALAVPLSAVWTVVYGWRNPMAVEWAIETAPRSVQPVLHRALSAFLNKFPRTGFVSVLSGRLDSPFENLP